MATARFKWKPTARPDAIGRVLEVAPWFWRDLSRDWRGWTIAERITAGVLLLGVAAIPVVALSGA